MALNNALDAIRPGTYTTSVSSTRLSNEDGKVVTVVVDVESITTGTLTVTVRGVARTNRTDGAQITWPILATTALNAANAAGAPTILQIGPGLPVTANVSDNKMVPLFFLVDAVKSDTSAWKFSVQYMTNT
jgi:hypothetical protein